MSDTEKATRPEALDAWMNYSGHKSTWLIDPREAFLSGFEAGRLAAEKAAYGTRTGFRDTDYSEGLDDGINIAVDVIRALRSSSPEVSN